jgi:hypothetical protein
MDVDNLDGNFMANIRIVKTLDTQMKPTNKVATNKKSKIIKLEQMDNRVEAVIQKGKKEKIKTGNTLYVYNYDGILSRSGDVVKELGKITVTDTDYDINKGTFYINNGLDKQLIEKYLSDLSLKNLHRFEFSIYTSLIINRYVNDFAIGAGVESYFWDDKLAIGIDLGINGGGPDLKLTIGATPYWLNSPYLSFGLEFQPLHLFYYENYYDYVYVYGPRYGLYGIFELKRFKFIPSLRISKSIYKDFNYRDHYESEYTTLLFSLTAKYRLN